MTSGSHLNLFAFRILLLYKLIEVLVSVASRLLQVNRGNIMITTGIPADSICHRIVAAKNPPLLGKRANSASCR